MFCFPISDHAIGSPENSFYPRAPVYMHYLLKDKKQIPLRTSSSSYKLKRSISLGESAFPLPRGGARAHFAARKLLTSSGHKSRRSSCAQNSASYFQWSILPKFYPHTSTLYPHSPKILCVLEGGGGRHTLVQAIQSGFCARYLAAQPFWEFAYRLMKVEVSHIYLPQLCMVHDDVFWNFGYCNQSDGFISHISPGIVINISGIQLVFNRTGVDKIIGFQ